MDIFIPLCLGQMIYGSGKDLNLEERGKKSKTKGTQMRFLNSNSYSIGLLSQTDLQNTNCNYFTHKTSYYCFASQVILIPNKCELKRHL